VIKFGAAKV
jgi:hypothetical protein